MKNDSHANLDALKANSYPGRGIVLGLDSTGDYIVQVYWIMGRSGNSRNRIFEANEGNLRTAAADPSKVKDPSLIIYNAMAEEPRLYVVSNGDQTDTIVEGDRVGVSFYQALCMRQYEPDTPNFTPRISAVSSLRHSCVVAEMAIHKKSTFGVACDRQFFRYEGIPKGFGFCVTSYEGDGNPLPAFNGEPYLLPLVGDIHVIAQSLFSCLNAGNRVSLAVKFICIKDGSSHIEVVNKYTKV